MCNAFAVAASKSRIFEEIAVSEHCIAACDTLQSCFKYIEFHIIHMWADTNRGCDNGKCAEKIHWKCNWSVDDYETDESKRSDTLCVHYTKAD